MQTSLHQNAGAAQGDRFIDLFTDFVYRAHVGIGRAGPAIKRAEGADDVADVRVIDVAVDDVRDDWSGWRRWRISSAAAPMLAMS
jgi:hypothetical protein